MKLRVLNYDERTQAALLVTTAGKVIMKISNVSRRQAERLARNLERSYRLANDARGTEAGIYLER